MKKQVLTGLIAACGVCAADTALAQSSVTMYGLADAGVQSSSFGNGRKLTLNSGIAEGSRIGFRGAEDLGGGYRAVFTLEARVEIDNGTQANALLSSASNQNLTQDLSQAGAAFVTSRLPVNVVNSAGALFDRQAFVGLATPYGTVLLGRQYTPGIEVFALSDAFELGTSGTWLNLASGSASVYTPGIALRANQALQYRLQLPSGVGMTAMYGFNNTGSLNLARRFMGASLRYRATGFDSGVAFNREQDQVGNKALVTLTAGASWVVGDAKLFAGFHRMKNDHNAFARALAPGLAATDAAALMSNLTLNGDIITLGMHYNVGPGRVMASVNRVNDKRAGNGDATMFALGYDYFLSKRTDMYVLAARIRNDNVAQYALGGGGYFGGSSSQRGRDGNSTQVGIRHRF